MGSAIAFFNQQLKCKSFGLVWFWLCLVLVVFGIFLVESFTSEVLTTRQEIS